MNAILTSRRGQVKSGRIGRGHINGFSTEWGDWMWDSDRLREMDVVLDEAYKAGVKLIIPLINDDTGEEYVFPPPSLNPFLTHKTSSPQVELGRLNSRPDPLPLWPQLERRGAQDRLVHRPSLHREHEAHHRLPP